ncbi:MAG: cell filamentation protein Fic, partial [Bacteroidetes bacterium CG_4_9_14_3_um_filter_41_19]
MKENHSDFILFKTEDEKISVDVRFEEDSVWLSQEQMATLFERDRSVIVKHIAKIFSEGELEEKSNVQFLHIANSDKPVKFY